MSQSRFIVAESVVLSTDQGRGFMNAQKKYTRAQAMMTL
jgi:hypothetical protein